MATTQRLLLALFVACVVCGAQAQDRFITVASTTSTEQSGLFILPIFEKKTGIRVRVVALGTGQALEVGRPGDADVVFVHAKAAEEKFMAEGQGVERYPVMYNDFILIGPKSDPAKIAGGKDILAAMKQIAATRCRSYRAVIAAARTRPSSNSGKLRESTSRGKRAAGIEPLGKAWVRRSTPRRG